MSLSGCALDTLAPGLGYSVSWSPCRLVFVPLSGCSSRVSRPWREFSSDAVTRLRIQPDGPCLWLTPHSPATTEPQLLWPQASSRQHRLFPQRTLFPA